MTNRAETLYAVYFILVHRELEIANQLSAVSDVAQGRGTVIHRLLRPNPWSNVIFNDQWHRLKFLKDETLGDL